MTGERRTLEHKAPAGFVTETVQVMPREPPSHLSGSEERQQLLAQERPQSALQSGQLCRMIGRGCPELVPSEPALIEGLQAMQALIPEQAALLLAKVGPVGQVQVAQSVFIRATNTGSHPAAGCTVIMGWA